MGQFSEYIKMALYNIKENKGRSFLTMLGIIIGISSVITIISIGNGLKADVKAQGETRSVDVAVDEKESTKLDLITWEDIQEVSAGLSGEINGVAGSSMATGSIHSRKGNFDAYVTLTTPEAVNDPKQKKLIQGNYFSEDDVLNAKPACVLDKASAKYLFGTTDVVGMDLDVIIENTVITVYIKGIRDVDEKLQKANEEMMKMFGGKMPVSMELPYTVAELWGEKPENFSAIQVFLAEGADENRIAKSAVQILDSRHRNEGENLFTKKQSTNMGDAMGTLLDTVTAFVAFVAGISLLVGGIGVMNIMLVSVTERTREIGIRRALGAKGPSIIAQFLLESAIISGLGGIIGILLGASVAGLISVLGIGGLSAKLSVTAIIFTTCFSCGVGIIFGIYPARKAAKMSPMEALRQF